MMVKFSVIVDLIADFFSFGSSSFTELLSLSINDISYLL